MTDRQLNDFLGRLTGRGPNASRVFTGHNESQQRADDFTRRLSSPLPRETGGLTLTKRKQTAGRTTVFRDLNPGERAG
ncbi:MAG TPA: hypothetical protein VFW33_07840 [Gemmataceae bacterium]|nr:hypothetical protein [Gemmataceae bacterium]